MGLLLAKRHPIRRRGFAGRQRGTTFVEIVELPPLKRGVEWPTVALAVAIYGLWLSATFFHDDLPWWALTALGAWVVTWQLSLQHETIHGHPTRNRRLNEAIGCWPLSLWLPYSIYRSTHLAHHRDENLTDPFEDPESYYWTASGWGGLGPVGRALAYARTMLLGRVTLGPAFLIGGFVRDLMRDAWRGKRGARAIVGRHLILCAPVLVWLIAICHMPLWAYLAMFVYPGASLAMVRSSPSIAPRRRRKVAPPSWRTPGSSGRSSCSTTCMRRITCGTGCPGIRSRHSIGSTGRR